MPYRPLAATRAPKSIRDFVSKHIDMQFADVHTMLHLPLDSDGLGAGCNFACVSSLWPIAVAAAQRNVVVASLFASRCDG